MTPYPGTRKALRALLILNATSHIANKDLEILTDQTLVYLMDRVACQTSLDLAKAAHARSQA